MYVVCHDGTGIRKGQQGTIYVASTMQTAVVEKRYACNSITGCSYDEMMLL